MSQGDRARGQEGFSIIELLNVILIIGILATMIIPTFLRQREKAHHASAREQVYSAAIASRAYFFEYGTFAGLTQTELQNQEKTASSTTPLTSGNGNIAPGPNANHKNVWIATATGGTAPVARNAGGDGPYVNQIVLCSVSKGSAIFCIAIDEQAGQIKYKRFKKGDGMLADTGTILDLNGTGAGAPVPEYNATSTPGAASQFVNDTRW